MVIGDGLIREEGLSSTLEIAEQTLVNTFALRELPCHTPASFPILT